MNWNKLSIIIVDYPQLKDIQLMVQEISENKNLQISKWNRIAKLYWIKF